MNRWCQLSLIPLGFLLPVIVLAGAALFYGSVDASISALIRGDILYVAPSPVYLEKVVPGSVHQFPLVLRNLTGRDVTIEEGRTSCGCLTVPLTGRVIGPHESVVVMGALASSSDDIGWQSFMIHMWLDNSDQCVQVPVEVGFVATTN